MSELLLGILDKLFKDDSSGKLLFSRVVALIVVFLILFVWYKGEGIMNIYRESRYSQYTEILNQEKEAKFTTVTQEQLQYVYISSGADFVSIYTFRPKNLNYFVDILTYQGKLPEELDPKNLGGFPIDKGSQEYQSESTGGYYSSTNNFPFLPSKDKSPKQIGYMFGCPYFNLDNIYSGSIEMYWYHSGKPDIDMSRLSEICGQASRSLGRAK